MSQFLIIIMSTLAILFIISILKRFFYFAPCKKYLEINEKYKEFSIKKLHGLELCNDFSRIIIYFPSNKKNISYVQDKLLELHNLGYNIITFDYSGFGLSKGIPNEQQLYDDACLITAMVLQYYSINNIILYGEQLGSSLATYVARRYSIPYLILESPIVNIKYIFNPKIHKLLHIFCKEFNSIIYLSGYQGNVLLLYTDKDYVDSFIPLSKSQIMIKNNIDLPFISIKEFIDS